MPMDFRHARIGTDIPSKVSEIVPITLTDLIKNGKKTGGGKYLRNLSQNRKAVETKRDSRSYIHSFIHYKLP